MTLNWTMANGAAETDDHRIDTICYPDYPTSYNPDAATLGRPLIASHTSRLYSIAYPFINRQARHLRMFTSSMKIIRAKLFRWLRSADPNGAGKNQSKRSALCFLEDSHNY
jgi:hypothetical protein